MSLPLLMISGCTLGMNNLNPGAAKKTTPPPQMHQADPLTQSDANRADPVRLIVNNESFSPSDLWIGHKDKIDQVTRGQIQRDHQNHINQLAAQLIMEKINESLLYQQASLKMPSKSLTQIDRYIEENIRKKITAEHNGVERRYVKWLESRGITLEWQQQKYRRELMVSLYLGSEIKPKIPEPTRKQMFEAYTNYAASNRQPPKRRMSLIQVRFAPTPATSILNAPVSTVTITPQEARTIIQAAWDEIQQGRSFADVAKQYSDGLNARDGGWWGWITRNSVREIYEPAVTMLYQLNTGEVSNVVESADRFFLVCCDELSDDNIPDFETAQPELKERIQLEQYNRLVSQLVMDLRSKSRISPANLEEFHLSVVKTAPKWNEMQLRTNSSK